MGRIILFPGSFSPLHVGHLCLANFVIERERDYYDELWFLLTPESPFKSEVSSVLLPEEVRARWANYLLGRHSRMSLCLDELSLPKPNYTYNTLAYLREKYPQHTFSLLIGRDSYLSLPRWYRGEEILAETEVMVYPRPGYCTESLTDGDDMPTQLSQEYGAQLKLLSEVPSFDVSSTRIRRMIQSGAHLPFLLESAVDDPEYQILVSAIKAL